MKKTINALFAAFVLLFVGVAQAAYNVTPSTIARITGGTINIGGNQFTAAGNVIGGALAPTSFSGGGVSIGVCTGAASDIVNIIAWLNTGCPYGTSVAASSAGSLVIRARNLATANIIIYQNSVEALAITQSVAYFARPIQTIATIKAGGYTVATLPTCNAAAKGSEAYVTDAAAPAWNAALSGGGAVVIGAFCNGTAWVAR